MALRSLHDLPAPAKLNAFLRLAGRRDDGYHLLQSAFVLIDWADVLHIECRHDGRLARHDLGPALPDDDLCLRAARALQQASGTTLGADLHVDKRVPWGAGMGGGSSDAATVLLALNRLWRLHWPRDRLLALALALGADVPFFVGGHNAWVEGIGERLSPLAWPATDYAVVKPPVSLPTRDVFVHPATRAVVDQASTAILAGSLAEAQQVQDLASGWGRNDLQPAAEELAPEVAQAARWLEARFGNSRMTGSGSAVYARVGASNSPEATRPDAGFERDLPAGWVGRSCRSLPIHPLAGWAD
ncbi:MAG: 4-(cytidine 5'-diphospho)-2-C-methyl-D-erythritol kinase [Rubrivivax sp.]|jgi:4-diphosphocytidyl-2-C-methyl-D-erythritol kinase|nr:4-(cytidine 5'-diphospho)-2-C-methyl-D-erythritol kinase [Rubrivivax sp.]